MTTATDGTPTPPEVETNATQEAKLPQIALIGIFGSTDAPRALIRQANGKIDRVAVGDKSAGGTVAAIDETRVIIARAGSTRVLKMPAG